MGECAGLPNLLLSSKRQVLVSPWACGCEQMELELLLLFGAPRPGAGRREEILKLWQPRVECPCFRAKLLDPSTCVFSETKLYSICELMSFLPSTTSLLIPRETAEESSLWICRAWAQFPAAACSLLLEPCFLHL